MSDVSKGNRLENEWKKKLEAHGFIAWKSGRRVFWIFDKKTGRRLPMTANNDIHGLFDLHAKNPDKPSLNYWFQVSTNWKGPKERAAMEAWPSGGYDHIYMVKRENRRPFSLRRLFSSLPHRNDYWWLDVTEEEFFAS